MAAVPTGARIRRRATAVVVIAHLHHRVHGRHPAGLPKPSQRGDDGNGGHDREREPQQPRTASLGATMDWVTEMTDHHTGVAVLACLVLNSWPLPPPRGTDDPCRAPRRTAPRR